jgi:hypothetical protein
MTKIDSGLESSTCAIRRVQGYIDLLGHFQLSILTLILGVPATWVCSALQMSEQVPQLLPNSSASDRNS